MLGEARPRPVGDALYPQVGGDETAARAIAFAQTYGTPLSPAVYEVWYIYAGRGNPKVNAALDLAMNTGQPISVETLNALYHDHVSPRSAGDDLHSIGADLHRAIGHVTDAMDENLREHSLFSGTLRSARNTLMQGTSKREVTEVIRELHRANQQHLQAAQKLSLQLEKSRAQVAKLKSELIEVRRMSNTDYLTGLPNRRMLDEHLDDAIFRARQRGLSLTFLLTGIEDMERVSRDFGIGASDNVIRGFAGHLEKELRAQQVAARFGGAKFAVVLPEADSAAAMDLAERVRRRFTAVDWVSAASGGRIGVLSVAVGGAVLRAGDTRESLIARADTALVQAQSGGRDRSLML